PDLDISSHGLTLWDLDREFATGSFASANGERFMKLRDILGVLRDAYCRTTSLEYMFIPDPDERRWFQERIEHGYTKPDREEQLRILKKLNQRSEERRVGKEGRSQWARTQKEKTDRRP